MDTLHKNRAQGTYWIADFQEVTPPHVVDQPQALEWLSAAHSQCGAGRYDPESLEKMRALLRKYGASPEAIETRRSFLMDFNHQDWSAMEIFRLDEAPQGLGLRSRMEFHEKVLREGFERLYPSDSPTIDELFHVTCTGYVSPSPAQRRLQKVRVTHLYHLGCYAALPALRTAAGALSVPDRLVARESFGRVDVVHSELCTLHMNPSLHTPEQLIVQSLFADGMIRYGVMDEAVFAAQEKSGLGIVALREERIPDSSDDMQWVMSEWGMKMALSRDVPMKIATRLEGYLKRLADQGRMDLQELLKRAIFAIHPGGPKIVDFVQAGLDLSERQVASSRAVLRERGNMSSATLPHIWRRIAEDPAVADGTRVVSLAFGPGLTLTGGIFEKRAVG